jgi:cyclopropane-fatty-acyl-phospholipid synthase
VLEIGCGWGGLAMHLAREKGARVHAITLSANQRDYAIARVKEAGLADRVTIDYRDYREVEGQYDRVVSIAMFEAVGRPNYRAYFDAAWRALKPDGCMLMHTIGRVDGPGDTDPWIEKYIFPGGYSPALSEILPPIERAGFYTTDIEVWRMHYAFTLREWYARCRAAKERIVGMHDERFYRMWMFYLAACVMAFEHLAHVVFQIQLQKRVTGPVPLTRDYLYR